MGTYEDKKGIDVFLVISDLRFVTFSYFFRSLEPPWPFLIFEVFFKRFPLFFGLITLLIPGIQGVHDSYLPFEGVNRSAERVSSLVRRNDGK